MREYRLDSAVPVEWLDLPSRAYFAWKSLKAGTLLDQRPIPIGDVVPEGSRLVAVRVDGHDGLVAEDRLQAALPGWN